MDSLTGGAPSSSTSTFFNKIFSTSSDSLSEIYNPLQFALIAFIPLFLLNKVIAALFPEPNMDSSSLVILAEIIFQICVMVVGVVIIYRLATYFPTYSGYKYESLSLTGPLMLFIVILLSIQSKMGIKTNILYERANELWNGNSETNKQNVRRNVRVNSPMSHAPSQADILDNTPSMSAMLPPAPVSAKPSTGTYDSMMRGSGMDTYMGPSAANSMLGSSFGSKF